MLYSFVRWRLTMETFSRVNNVEKKNWRGTERQREKFSFILASCYCCLVQCSQSRQLVTISKCFPSNFIWKFKTHSSVSRGRCKKLWIQILNFDSPYLDRRYEFSRIVSCWHVNEIVGRTAEHMHEWMNWLSEISLNAKLKFVNNTTE